MKRYGPAILLLMALVLVPVCCHAAGLSDLRVSCSQAESMDDVRSVSWYTQPSGRNERYIFLPAEADASDLRIWLKGAESVTVDGVEVRSGDAIALVPGTTVKVASGKKTYNAHVMQAGQQGSVYLALESGTLTKVDREQVVNGTALVVGADGNVYTDQAMPSFRMRGNGSAYMVKKSYQMKLESKADLFGMGKSKTWLLISNYKDWSNVRNMLVYEMARYAGLAYTPECVYVNVYIDHEYRGLYLLSEKLQVSSSRIDLDDLQKEMEEVNSEPLSSYPTVEQTHLAAAGKGRWQDIPNDPEDITGTYLMKIELNKRFSYRKYLDEPAYSTKRKISFLFKEPKYMSKTEYTYITSLLQSLEDAIFADDGVDPTTGKHYTEIADFDSLVLKYMLEEVSANYDGSLCSQYFYKPKDSVSEKIYAGPAWDYDSSWGAYLPNGQSKKMMNSLFVAGEKHYAWWAALYRRSEFAAAVKEKWKTTYSHAMAIILGEEKDPTGTLQSIDELVEEIAASNEMDYIKWPYHRTSGNKCYGGKEFSDNLNYLRQIVTMRRDYLKSVWE